MENNEDDLDFNFDFDLFGNSKDTPKKYNNQYEEAKDLMEGKTFEQVAKEELNEALTAFKAKAKHETELQQNNTSTDYWFCVYFKNSSQLIEFLQKSGFEDLVEWQYINGEKLADRLNVPITKLNLESPKPFRKPKDITDNDILEFDLEL